jgi:hypothetical protein
MVIHVCNPSYRKGIGRRIAVQGQQQTKIIKPYLKIIKAPV